MDNVFGKMGEFDKLNKALSEIEKAPLIENESEETDDTDDVVVPTLEKDVYVPSKKDSKEDLPPGSAGTSTTETPEPILGSMGGFAANPTPKMEGFAENDPLDEDAQKKAVEGQNIVDKVKDGLNDIFDKKFKTPKTIQADMDATHPKSKVSESPFKEIPKGW